MNLLRLPVPTPRQALVLVLVALSVGVVTGRALDAGTAAADSALLLAKAPPHATSSPGASGATYADSTLSAPAGNVAPEPPAPAPAPSTLAPPAPTIPAAEPSQPADHPPPADHHDSSDEPTRPTDDQSVKLSGTVVQANPDARAYTLATADGDLIEVHARKLPDVGALVEAHVVELANGTRKEVDRSEVGSDPTAKLKGTVTFVAPDQAGYVVSTRGTSLLVHSAPGRPLPALLDLATVQVSFADPPPGLTESSLQVDGRASGAVDMHGKIVSVDPQTRTLVLPADDLEQSGLDISLLVPAELDLSALEPGHVIAATVELNPDGSYRLTAADGDDDARAADRADY